MKKGMNVSRQSISQKGYREELLEFQLLGVT